MTDTQEISTTETDPLVVPYLDDGNTERLTHIVNPPMNYHISGGLWKMTAKEIVDAARITGQEVVALCGKRWVPLANPDKYDACKTCVDIAGEIMRGMGQ